MDEITLRNLFMNVDLRFLDDAQKALTFFKLAIELERMKEPDIRDYYEYPINYRSERIMLVDFPCNESFRKLFEENRNPRKTRYPSDLYIGLKIKTGDVTYRLLNMVIAYNDINAIHIEDELLPVKIADFEVNLKEASRLELLPEMIERINAGIENNPTWQGILTVLQQEIAEDVTIVDNLFLALSNRSMELSQIYSELNSKHLQVGFPQGTIPSPYLEAPRQHSLLESFLLNEPIDNFIESIDPDNLICVTSLDDSQKEAIAKALGNRISVITGAPGTGKTQVIENILANALIRGKKVLVASKNNKAVDNVKDRFDNIDETGSLLRFGARSLISNSTLPDIERILNEIGNLQNSRNDYEACKTQYEQAIQDIKEAKNELEKIEQLQNELIVLENSITEAENALKQIDNEHCHNVENINNTYIRAQPLANYSTEELNQYRSSITSLNNNLTAKFYGFFGFWHRMFSVKKSAALFLNEVERFPYNLNSYATRPQYGLYMDIARFRSSDVLFSQIRKWQDIINMGLSYKHELSDEERRYRDTRRRTENNLNRVRTEKQEKDVTLNTLEENRPFIQSRMEDGKRWILDNSIKMLSLGIQYYKLQDGAVHDVTTYKGYLLDQIPWRDSEYALFVQQTRAFLNIFRLCAVTSLSIKNAFPLAPDLFDMVVIDEASQCDVASALPLIMRTKQLVVIGDPMQLRHISAVRVEEEQDIKERLDIRNSPHLKYAECSLYDYCKDYISHAISGLTVPYMLQYHYRCYPPIIRYSNDRFYGGVMGRRLEIRTNVNQLKGQPQGIVLVNVIGRQTSDNININEAEAQRSIEIATQTAQTYPDVSIGIVTPFRHQAERINSLIPSDYADRIEANTVYKYQGEEKDVVIYSLVVTSNSPDSKIRWIDNVVPNLVNVAVTRAKSTLYVVGNLEYIRSHSNVQNPLGYLVRYNN